MNWGFDVLVRRPLAWGLTKLISNDNTAAGECFIIPDLVQVNTDMTGLGDLLIVLANLRELSMLFQMAAAPTFPYLHPNQKMKQLMIS